MKHATLIHRPLSRRQALMAGSLAALGLAIPAHASRDKALRLLCSGPAGSIPDLVARAVSEQLPSTDGSRALVDNRPGAAGRLSIAALKAAPVDGSTLLVAQGAIATVFPLLYDKPGYDAATDLQPVSLASEMVLGLAVGPAVPPDVTSIAGFTDWLRRNPNAANVGSPGAGTLPHLLEAMLFHAAGVPWQHVAYPGGPPAVTALLGGQIAALVLPEGLLRQHHGSGRLRVLATSGATRLASLPAVPTFAESGHPGLAVQEWFAFFAPGRTPQGVLATLSGELQDALARPGVTAAFAAVGMVAVGSSPSALAARIASEQKTWQQVLRTHGIHAD